MCHRKQIIFSNLKYEHADQVAQLHVQGIQTGFISSLGDKFVTTLYKQIALSDYAFGVVAIENAQVLGFVAFTTNLSGLYKSVILKGGFRLVWLLAGKLFSWKTIKRIFETLFYPNRVKNLDLPSAELLSIAIDQKAQGKGIATALIKQGLAECSARGIDRIKLLVAQQNEAANQLYLKCGFQLHSQIESHGIVSNLYVVETASE